MPPPFYGIIRAFPTPNTPFSDLTFFLSLPLEVSGLKYMLSLLQGSYQVWKGQVFDHVVTLLVKLLVQVCIKIKTTKTGAEYCQHWCTPNRYVMKIKSPVPALKNYCLSGLPKLISVYLPHYRDFNCSEHLFLQ